MVSKEEARTLKIEYMNELQQHTLQHDHDDINSLHQLRGI